MKPRLALVMKAANDLNQEHGAHPFAKVLRTPADHCYQDQWLLGAYAKDEDTLIVRFCQGRSTGAIRQVGGYPVEFDVSACQTAEQMRELVLATRVKLP